ncbi:hypothetical protein K435DRAFT_903187 [Dendrothele bispora CBS 962.96]|uniref:Uncharacterized protein n=1 Tax=Dendrothele bispora (strain CBS 962.96) TaxID=1314807 RepID=A0A4S8MNP5_DENBC|nr:hypothetical protein K435DRAFT_903187 [Dendrothele bispora CBS 962.96]
MNHNYPYYESPPDYDNFYHSTNSDFQAENFELQMDLAAATLELDQESLNQWYEQNFELHRAPSVDQDLPENPYYLPTSTCDYNTPARSSAALDFFESGDTVGTEITNTTTSVPPTPEPTQPAGRKRRRKSKQAEVEPTSTTVTPSPALPPTPVEIFSAVIHILKPDTITRSRGKAKTTKHEPDVRGPVHAPIDISFEAFLDIIRVEMGLQHIHQLCVDSFAWYFEGKKSSKLPLKSESGMTTLQMRLGARKAGSEKFIVLEMTAPLNIVQSVHKLTGTSLASTPAGTTSSLLVLSQPMVDEDEFSGDDEGPMAKKACIDDTLEAIVSQILEAYPTRNCKDHPDKHCFYHSPTKQHFDVGFRPASLLWAAKIRSKKGKQVPSVDITRIPIGSAYFTPKNAMKILALGKKPDEIVSTPKSPFYSGHGVTPSPGVVSPVPTDSIALQLSQISATQAQMQMMLLSGQGGLLPFTPRITTPAAKSSDDMRSSSPPLPDNTLSLAEFCQQYKFNDDIQERLRKMEFEPGDNLQSVKEDKWSKVGFTELSWKRVMKANKVYRKTLQYI